MNGMSPLGQQQQMSGQVGPMAQMGAQQAQQPDLSQIKQMVQQEVAKSPEAQAAIDDVIQDILSDDDFNPGEIGKLIKTFEFALQHPEEYPKLRQAMIAEGMDADDIPTVYNQEAILALLAAFYIIEQRMTLKKCRGGLARYAAGGLAAQGRGGDTMVAHINPFEAAILKSYGGSGRVNPDTGYPEFGWFKKLTKSIGKVFKKALPILSIVGTFIPVLSPFAWMAKGLTALAPGLTAALGTMGTNALGGAILGGVTGGAKGAALGALGGYSAAGGATQVGNALGVGAEYAKMAGAAALGGVGGAVTGQDPLKSALTAGVVSNIGDRISNSDFAKNMGSGVAGTGLQGAVAGANLAAQTGGDPMTGMAYGALSGAGSAALQKMGYTPFGTPAAEPTKKVLTPEQRDLLDTQYADGTVTREQYIKQTGIKDYELPPTPSTMTDKQASDNLKSLDAKYSNSAPQGMPKDWAAQEIGKAGYTPPSTPQSPTLTTEPGVDYSLGAGQPKSPLGSTMTNTPATQAPAFQLSPDSAFNITMASQFIGMGKQQAMDQAAKNPDQRPYVDTLKTWNVCDSAADFGTCWANNWDNFNSHVSMVASNPNQYAPKFKCGGKVRYAQGGYAVGGPGDGQSDEIPAMLSDGEFVIPADVVSALGSGSTEAGAKQLHRMMEQVRRGYRAGSAKDIPRKSKSPLQYLKEGVR